MEIANWVRHNQVSWSCLLRIAYYTCYHNFFQTLLFRSTSSTISGKYSEWPFRHFSSRFVRENLTGEDKNFDLATTCYAALSATFLKVGCGQSFLEGQLEKHSHSLKNKKKSSIPSRETSAMTESPVQLRALGQAWCRLGPVYKTGRLGWVSVSSRISSLNVKYCSYTLTNSIWLCVGPCKSSNEISCTQLYTIVSMEGCLEGLDTEWYAPVCQSTFHTQDKVCCVNITD